MDSGDKQCLLSNLGGGSGSSIPIPGKWIYKNSDMIHVVSVD